MRSVTGRHATLTGWGRTNPSVARVVPVGPQSAAHAVAEAAASGRGAIPRGAGRSYGDSAQNGGGTVVCLGDDIADAVLDTDAGTIRVGGGVTLDSLLCAVVPLGWMVPVVPGTRFVTVGGAIASDIHGKNHHVDGSFGNHVERLSLLMADGSVRSLGRIDPDERELVNATIGGMGLTGLILDATVKLLPIETSMCTIDTDRTGDLDELMALMSEGDDRYRYSVAWVDLAVTGRSLGRGILARGDHAPRHAVESAREPLAYSARQLISVPPIVPNGAVNPFTIRAFNELWYRKAPRRRRGELQTIPQFFHPLDGIKNWNRAFGPQGFLQYQFVVPFGQEAALRRIIERAVALRHASPVSVLKRFGDGNDAPLSFPTAGWTFTLDITSGVPGLAEEFRQFDRIVLDAGGRHYLAKDAHMSAATLRAGYRRLDEWRAVRDKADPAGVWMSDQARRLGLC